MSTDIFNVLKSTISDEFGIDEGLVTPEVTFEALKIDSMDLMQLAQVIEEKYAVALSPDLVKQRSTLTIAQVVEHVEALIADKK